MFIIVTMQKVTKTLMVRDLYDDFFMLKFISEYERKITVLRLNQKTQSPDDMVVSPVYWYLSLNGLGEITK